MKTGDKFKTNNCGELEIVSIVNSKKVLVKFIETGTEIYAIPIHIRNGQVRDPIYPNIFGLGYLGIGDHMASINRKGTKAYSTWRGMLTRCYDIKFQSKNRNYVGCTVSDDWHNFQNFAAWFEKNYKEGFEIDKDILVAGNRIYSESTCVFVPQSINKLIISSNASRGDLPLGVSRSRGRCRVMISQNGKLKGFGIYKSIEDAEAVYKVEKYRIAKETLSKYLTSGQLSSEVCNAVMQRIKELN